MPPEDENEVVDEFAQEDFVLETDKFTGETLDELGTEEEEKEEESTEEVEEESTEEEETEESEEESEEEEEPEQEEEPQGLEKSKPIMIPKHRYDSASARAKAAEEKLAAYEAKLESKQPAAKQEVVDDTDKALADLDLKRATALADGDVDLAAKISGEIRMLEKQAYQAEIKRSNSEVESSTVAKMKFDAAVDSITQQYDVFDPDSDNYDQAIVDETLDLQSAFEAKGYSATEALYKAVGYVIKDEVATEAPEAKKETPAARKTDVKKNVDAAKRTPPSLEKSGLDSDATGAKAVPNATELSEEDFDALPEATKARMRGDLVS
jgi:hypothetical protein